MIGTALRDCRPEIERNDRTRVPDSVFVTSRGSFSAFWQVLASVSFTFLGFRGLTAIWTWIFTQISRTEAGIPVTRSSWIRRRLTDSMPCRRWPERTLMENLEMSGNLVWFLLGNLYFNVRVAWRYYFREFILILNCLFECNVFTLSLNKCFLWFIFYFLLKNVQAAHLYFKCIYFCILFLIWNRFLKTFSKLFL